MINVIVRLDCSKPDDLLDPPSKIIVAYAELETEFDTVAFR
jgi:hypothetical protein